MLVYVYATTKKHSGYRVRTEVLEGSNGQINIDYGPNGEVIGIEFLDAKRVTTEEENGTD
jgi:uncharacterized protein YuzE